MNQNEMVATVEAAQVYGRKAPAIESKPLVGSEVTIKLALTPGTMTLIAAPVTVAVTMIAGWIFLTSLAMPTYVHEMMAAGAVNTVGGVLAALPLFFLMKRGTQAIAQAALLGIALRCACTLMALMLAMGPGWGLSRMALVYWVLGGYFPLLMVETAVVAWLSNKATH